MVASTDEQRRVAVAKYRKCSGFSEVSRVCFLGVCLVFVFSGVLVVRQ